MQYTKQYSSPLGNLLLAADEQGLTGLWFEGAKYFAATLADDQEEKDTPILEAASRWLDAYFAGKRPEPFQPLHILGTDFQKTVWEILRQIPYGQTTTYQAIARQIAAQRGLDHMSSQAIGSAVGRNPISIIIPCHRVIGTNGSLTGYAGGVKKKAALLKLEQAYTDEMFIPEKEELAA